METEHSRIAALAQTIGAKPEYVQGGGGNVSIKISPTEMAVKASGFRLADLNATHGLVGINYQTVRGFYDAPPAITELPALIAASDALVQTSLLSSDSTLRPSIETGFHAILGPVVLHTHSVYANILTCAEEGEEILKRLFPDAVFVPYHTPGVALTFAIQKALRGASSDSIFLENHGLIVVGESTEKAYDLHETINATIKKHFAITKPYPTVSLEETESGWQSATPVLSDFIRNHPEVMSRFKDTVLFPDQVVYGDQLGFDTTGQHPITINLERGTVTYSTKAGEAHAIEETLIAWSYIYNHINDSGLSLKTLSADEGNFIVNLDSEKYRKGII